MDKKYIFANSFIILFFICSIPFLDEFWVSTFLIISPAYFFFYWLYLAANRICLFRRKIRFNDRIFFIPLFTFICGATSFFLVNKEYVDIDKYVNSYLSKNTTCAEVENCTTNPNGFYIKTWLSKNYRVIEKNGCIYVRSPSYALIKYNYEKCGSNNNSNSGIN